MEMTEGYEIQKTILFETGNGIALGCMAGEPERFAVWVFTETAYGRDYYLKRCPDNREAAEKVFRVSADRCRGFCGIQEKTEHSTKKYYRYYSTQRPVDVNTFPKPEGNHPLMIFNYDEDRRRPVAGGRLCAWGELVYPYPLTKEQADAYELKPEPAEEADRLPAQMAGQIAEKGKGDTGTNGQR